MLHCAVPVMIRDCAHGIAPLLLAFVLCACARTDADGVSEDVLSTTQPVVYGEDDRLEVYRYNGDTFARASQSLVALVPPGLIASLPEGGLVPSPEPAMDVLQLCEDEPFVTQPAVAACSGVLIDDDLVLTAGHCFREGESCDVYAYVFDYHYSRPGQSPDLIDLDVYGCKKLIVRERKQRASGVLHDFAVVQLDRKVDLRRRPVPIRTEQVESGEGLTVMGSPQGLPAKIDTGGAAKPSPPPKYGYFFADTDTFGGSSGSPAYDDGRELIGILIRGNQDYVEDPESYCLRAKRLSEDETTDGRFEQFAYLAPALAALCQTEEGQARPVCNPPAPVRGKASLACNAHPDANERAVLSSLWGLAGLWLCARLLRKRYSNRKNSSRSSV